jgi:hypothetical protein
LYAYHICHLNLYGHKLYLYFCPYLYLYLYPIHEISLYLYLYLYDASMVDFLLLPKLSCASVLEISVTIVVNAVNI